MAKKIVIIDIETDDLNATRIHCISTRVFGSTDISVFIGENDWREFKSFGETVDVWVGHNILGFDAPVINRLVGCGAVPLERCVDTLILSKLIDVKYKHGHSLRVWGERLGILKKEIKAFSTLTQEMIDYCIQDVNITHAIYERLSKKLEPYSYAVELEHFMHRMCSDMHENGFPFKMKEAKEIYEQLKLERSVLDSNILTSFPTKYVADRIVVPSLTSKGTLNRSDFRWYKGDDYTRFEPGAGFTVIKKQEFNPASPKQLVDRLWEAGWKPTERTKGALANTNREKKENFKRYGWKVSEKNLSTLPSSAPEGAKLLLRRLIINTRITQLETWFENYNPCTGKIHGLFNSLGTWTHRMSHTKPNMANVAAKKSIKYNSPELRNLATELGGAMRGLWGVHNDSGLSLVGTDAEGIQLRVFAHLVNDASLIESLVKGDKAKGTDPHSLNLTRINEAFGPGTCKDRDRAKTFLYAFFLGAGNGKIAEIFNVSLSQANDIKEYMSTIYPGLKTLKKRIQSDAKRGYFINLDGRTVKCDSEHKMLSGYLQAGEASIMKVAVRKATEKLQDARLSFRLVNLVHDEMLFLGPSQWVLEACQITEEAIAWAGQELKLNCPMKGEAKHGLTWLDVH